MAEDPLTTHARARVGRVLRGKWTLDRLIGVGGMAAVYEATHRNGSKVAIKMLHPTLMYDTNFASRLVQEGYVANKINHPAAVKVFDDDKDETDGTVFLVMELLEGQTLSQARKKKKRFAPIEALKMLAPVLECLGNAHDCGIIHRDIKPENLFITKDGVVHVLDFGIARVSDGSNVSQTRTGMVVGSPAYMSPEQALGKMNSVGPQTDVYAVGATMFALLAGATPHAGESTQEMIVMVATQAARPIASVAPDVPPNVARIVDKALAYEREKRYPNARAMLEEVRAVIAELEGPARVLPTFADDDDEGETTVNAALQSGGNEGGAAPLPAAGMNRVGQRPQTGRFAPAVGPAPITEGLGAPPVPPPTAAPPDPARLRPPTLAPVGSPAAMPGAFQPQPPQPPAPPAPPIPAPASADASGQIIAPFNAQGSGPHALPAFPTDNGDGASLPPTMAIPVINPIDLASNTGPGVTSGQRPGATTNMAWATPPAAPVEEAPPARKPRTALFAAVAVGVLALGGGAFMMFGSSSEAPPPPVQATRPTPPTPPPSPVAVQVPAAPSDADAAPLATDAAVAVADAAPSVDAGAAVVAATTDASVPDTARTEPSTAQGGSDPATVETPPTRSARRRVREAAPASGGDTNTPTRTTTRRPARPAHGRDPLGY